MSSPTSPAHLLDQANAMIEEMGGARKLIDDLAEFQQLRIRMTKEHAALIEKFPDQWVVVGLDGLLAVGNSEDEVLQAIDDRGIVRSDVVVEFLDTDPPVLIFDHWPLRFAGTPILEQPPDNPQQMTIDLSANVSIMLTIITVGIALAGLIWKLRRDTQQQIQGIHGQISELDGRMRSLESRVSDLKGFVEGFSTTGCVHRPDLLEGAPVPTVLGQSQ